VRRVRKIHWTTKTTDRKTVKYGLGRLCPREASRDVGTVCFEKVNQQGLRSCRGQVLLVGSVGWASNADARTIYAPGPAPALFRCLWYINFMSESDTNLDDLTAPDDQQEDASDFVQDVRVAETQAVLAATDWTTQTVLIQLTKGNIELNPNFQRRDAWRPARKSRFIESLILGISIPQLVLAERKNKKLIYSD
jgi:hypothetical protein